MKHLYLLLILWISTSSTILSQERLPGRNYFDYNWNLSNEYNYSYYREAYKYKSGYYHIYDYFMDGKMQSEAFVDNYNFACGKHPSDCGAKEGYIKWYYTNGYTERKERFSSGYIISIEQWDYYGNKTSQSGCISGECNSGYGTYVYSNGDYYTGYFINGRRHGKGTYVWNDGTSRFGDFQNNNFVTVSNNNSSITLNDVKTGLEVINEVVKLYQALTRD